MQAISEIVENKRPTFIALQVKAIKVFNHCLSTRISMQEAKSRLAYLAGNDGYHLQPAEFKTFLVQIPHFSSTGDSMCYSFCSDASLGLFQRP